MSAVEFELDGRKVQALDGETILQAAERLGTVIPRLCYTPGYRADGNCRACVVEIDGERTLAPSCCRAPAAGMKVKSTSDRAVKSQKMVVEMLLSDMPEQGHKWNDGAGEQQHGELSDWAARLGITVRPALKALTRHQPAPDVSHPAMAVNLDACIQCNRCVRACREEQVNDVIGYAFRGGHSAIVFDLADGMGDSTCVACGECVQACPTGALMPKTLIGSQVVDKKVDSVCPFCGVGCLLKYNVRGGEIVSVEGRDGPANHNRLCVKGRFGFDYVHHPQRLTKPLIRKPGMAKDSAEVGDPARWREVFREATWDEALDLAAGSLKGLRDRHGLKALAGFGSAKGSNEEAYLFQKLVRTGFGSNNVDHCTRLCHASSVAALLEGVGSAAVSNQVNDVEHAEMIFVIGSNPTANHPVAATWMKNAAKRGAKIVLADPRITDIGRYAWRTLQFRADADVALLNALIHTVIDEGLANEEFIRDRASNYEALKKNVLGYSAEAMAPICGIPAETIREVARAFATAKSAMILWGMGISQHVHGTDNARCLIALVTVTGQIGKPGSGLHPLRGQNNVQGASDAGLIPMMLPNYQRVTNVAARERFEKFWGTKLDEKPGYTVVEIMDKCLVDDSDPHKVRGMYIMGENPAMSDPDLNHAREALCALDHLVVQDIFMTETAWYADVVLPASAWPEKTGTVTNTDRMVQMGNRALDPPGDARQDLWIIQEIARRIGLPWNYQGPESGVAAVYEEMRQAMKEVIGGISWERVAAQSSVTYPCLSDSDPGQPTVFVDRFPTEDGRVKLVPADIIPANERPDVNYPFVLITGRQLEHWHTGSMTRRAAVLDAIEPIATASMNGSDLQKLGLSAGDTITVRSRRGEVSITVRRDDGTPDGAVFIPFAYYEAAANVLTNAALDPFGKIPEFKYCAVSISRGGTPLVAQGYSRVPETIV
ncbi:MAG: formate dehydrogenase subunit alpha [Proteobacteria bacterium]|nr:formate dehydrogenase subunit alpha [Pseudomonadota bacterium]MBK7114650.1 formate dehydrogenase subunit alpha [Pseudomonadota bacterium]